MTIRDPKDHILAVAQKLFMERGLEAVSLRAVTAEAGVNLAAVNYYFGSKAGLLNELTQTFFAGINAEQLQRLADLGAQGLPSTIEEILDAYAGPIFALFDSKQGRDWVQAWVMARSEAKFRQGTTTIESAVVTNRYNEALREALPWLQPDELRWRFERATSLLMANQGKRTMPGLENNALPDNARWLERRWLITFLAGALQSSSTPSNETT